MYTLLRKIPFYIPLVGIIGFGMAAFALFSPDKSFLTAVVIAMSVSYVVWGCVYHFVHGDFSILTLVEYISIAILGSVSVLTVLTG